MSDDTKMKYERGKRRYLLRLSNPTDEEIVNLICYIKGLELSPKVCVRANFGREGGDGTISEITGEEVHDHIQGFIHYKNTKGMKAVKKLLGSQRWKFIPAFGTDFENWRYTSKDNRLIVSHGEPPLEEGEPSIWERILMMIRDSPEHPKSTYEAILEKYPAVAIRCETAIYKLMLREQKKVAKWRDISVTYVTGKTGCGKTRFVTSKYGYNNVYRVTNRKHPFDNYDGEPVILFEEFRSGIKFEEMLSYIDGHPIMLPCRYANKMAQFTKVYLCSNWLLEDQYSGMRAMFPRDWAAWRRRIHNVIDMDDEDSFQARLFDEPSDP